MPAPKPGSRRLLRASAWRLVARRWLGIAIGSLALATFVLGLGGFTWQYAGKPHAPFDFTIPLFKTVQLFLLNSGAEDDADHPSNWLLMLARLSTSLLFLVVSSTVILRVLDEIRKLPRQLSLKRHRVICGLGAIGLQLLHDLKDRDSKAAVVVIEPDESNPGLEHARALGADVVVGDATRALVLREARAAHAEEVFAVTGDDGANVELAAELAAVIAKDAKPSPDNKTRLHLHIADTQLAVSLQPNVAALHDGGHLAVHVFNVPRNGAARLATQRLHDYTPRLPDEVAHFVIVGFGAMGQTLAVQLAQMGHYANLKRPRFTIADADPANFRTFLARYPRFTTWSPTPTSPLGIAQFSAKSDSWSDSSGPLPAGLRVEGEHAIQYACCAQFRALDSAGDEGFARELAGHFGQGGVKPIVFVCGQKDRENFDAAVRLSAQLACQGVADAPMFVWLPRQPALAGELAKGARFQPFGECRDAASHDEIVRPLRESLGRVLHEDYERQQAAKSMDYQPQPWAALREEMRESNRQAADHLQVKLAHHDLTAVHKLDAKTPSKLDLSNVDMELLARMEHNRWIAERLLAGWRYAPEPSTKDEKSANKARRLNANLVPWEALTDEVRAYDFNQVRAWIAACTAGDFRLQRLGEGGG